MKAVGDEVKLRCMWPPLPVEGDVLGTRSGKRHYLVRRIRGRTLHCVVVPLSVPATFEWVWSKSNKWSTAAKAAPLQYPESRES